MKSLVSILLPIAQAVVREAGDGVLGTGASGVGILGLPPEV